MDTRQPQNPGTTDPTAVRTELLSRLGLPADASAKDVEAAHRAAVALLEHVPSEQRAWAQDQLVEVEAVCSLLAETAPAAAPAPAKAAAPSPANEKAVAAAKASALPSRGRSRLIWVAAAAVVVIGGAFGVYTMNASASVPGITGTPDTSTASSAAPVDAAKVSALMQKISANPKDVASLSALADLYFQAGDYKNSSTFSKDITEIDAKNVSAWVGLGAAQFNLGDATAAEKSWLAAVAIDPKNAEAHYDLGFLYLSAKTPDVAKVKTEWEKVIAIDPTSDIAKTVKTHLTSLESASPSASSGK